MRKILMGMAMLFLAYATNAQTQLVTGKVTDEKGTAIPQATVLEKGTKNGTFAADDGAFSIKVKPKAILVISAIGYETKEVPSSEAASIVLKTDTRSLSEVVVTGTGTATSKKKLGISVESVSADKLPAAPTASIDQALIGKIPGAQISTTSGNPGDPVNILLRGINTVQGGTKPLIMVDGVEVKSTDINTLDLANVDRVEVVQGAASAAIYGAQGANGVIQVFTKRGKKGRTAVNYSTSYSTNEFLNTGNVHKADKHPYLTDANNNIVSASGTILDYNDVGSIEGISYKYGGAARYYIQDIRNVANTPYNANLKYYDHFKQVFQTGYTLNNSINVSGAGDKNDYALSVSNNNTLSPILKNGFVNRTNVTANIGAELFKGFKVRSVTQLVYTKNTLHPGLGAFGSGGNKGDVGRVYGFLNTSPFFDLTRKLKDGTYPLYQTADFLSVNAGNPFYQQEYSKSVDNKIDIVQSFDANYVVNKFVELDAKYGIDYQNRNVQYTFYNQSQNLNSIYYDPNYIGVYAPTNTGEIDNWQYNTTNQNFLATAFIKTDFQNDFHLKIPIQTNTQIGYDYRNSLYKQNGFYGLGLPLAPPINITATGTQAVSSDYVEPFITYGYFVNQQIEYGDYGGITAGFRSDWSSAFGGGSKPFTFPHFDGHILVNNIINSDKLSNILPYFKIRAAYGQAGIQPGAFDRYPQLNQQNIGSALTYNIPTTSKNPNLQVEVSKEFETGTDFTFNVNKGGTWFKTITGAFTYWQRTSENVIYTVSAPPSSGATGGLTNAIGMSSNGIQFSLNIPVYSSRDFKWDFTTNFGHQTSKIDKIAGGSDIILGTSAGSTALVLTPGQKIGQIYGYKALTSLDYKNQEGERYIAKADEDKYTIVDGRVVSKSTYQMQFTNETYPLGDPNPKFNSSFINSFSYKDILSFSFQIDWIYGSHLYNQTKEWMYRDGISGDFTKPVTIDGNTGAFTAYWSSAYYNLWGSLHGAGNNATKDFYYEDASFARLRNVSVSVNLEKFLKVPFIKKAQLVLTGRNLFTITKYTGYDPEISSGAVNSSFDRGVDHSTLPNIKSYQVGLNIGF
jgi:TonB-linked SusC/RagA family outer membrane protein